MKILSRLSKLLIYKEKKLPNSWADGEKGCAVAIRSGQFKGLTHKVIHILKDGPQHSHQGNTCWVGNAFARRGIGHNRAPHDRCPTAIHPPRGEKLNLAATG
jgi:hypothetical protein